MKLIGKILKGLGVVFILLIVLAMCSPSKKEEPIAEKPVEQTVVEEPAKEEPTTDTDTVLKTYKVLLDSQISDNFEGYESNVQDKILYINTWASGIALGYANAAAGNQESIDSWNYLVESTRSACETTYNSIKNDLGLKDAHVSFNVKNDINTDNILISILDGVVVYDALADAN